jgi:hypothetical protein
MVFFRWSLSKQQYRLWWGNFLFLSKSHFFRIKMGLGPGSNNNSELMALKLLRCLQKKNMFLLFEFLVTLCWLYVGSERHNDATILSYLHFLMNYSKFSMLMITFLFRHVYRECNQGADLLHFFLFHSPLPST